VLGLGLGCALAPGGFDSWPVAIILLVVAVILLFIIETNLFYLGCFITPGCDLCTCFLWLVRSPHFVRWVHASHCFRL